jgi:hypothetical protein
VKALDSGGTYRFSRVVLLPPALVVLKVIRDPHIRTYAFDVSLQVIQLTCTKQ